MNLRRLPRARTAPMKGIRAKKVKRAMWKAKIICRQTSGDQRLKEVAPERKVATRTHVVDQPSLETDG